MAAPDNAVELLPVTWQITIAVATLATTLAGVGWRFFKATSGSGGDHHDQRVVLEQAELADMTPVRDFLRDFRPALEKIARIENMSVEMKGRISELCEKMERMERAALVAKEVREELARRTGELERRDRRRDRNDE